MADYKGLTIAFEGNADKLSTVLHQISSSAKAAQGELTGIQNALKFDPSNMKLYGNQVQQTSTLLKAAKDRQSAFSDAIGKSKRMIADYTRDLQRMRNAGMQDTPEYQATLAALDAERDRLASLQAEYDKSAAAVQKFSQMHSDAVNQFAVHATAMSKFGASAIQAGEGLQALGGHIETLGQKLTILTPFQTLNILRGFEGAAEQFGNVISQVGGYLDIEGAQLQEMGDLALKWGKDTKYSAVEAGNAISELAKGGLTDAEIKGGALQATMELAAAGNITMANAANVAVQAIKTFGLEAGNSTAIADALAGAANKSTAEISDLSQGFVQVGGWARLAGWDINDTAGALALMADRGYTGAMAGTSLKVMLQRLAAPTEKAATTMKELGIEVRNSDGTMKDATEIVDQFNNAMSGLNDEQRDTALQTIFGTRAINAMLALMQEGSDGLQSYIDATERMGYAQEMAQAQLGDLGWAMELLRGEAETAAVNVGNVMTPTLIDLAKSAEGVLTAFNEADKGTQEFIVQLGLAGIAAGPAISIFGRLVSGLGGVFLSVGRTSQGIAAFLGQMGEGAGVATAFGNAMSVASGGAVTAEAALGTLAATIKGLGVTALIAALAGLVHINQEYQRSLQKVDDAHKRVDQSAGGLDTALQRVEGGLSSVNEQLEETKDAYDAAEAMDRLADANENLADTITRNNDSYLATRDRLTEAKDALSQYVGQSGLTYDQQAQLKLAIDTLNDALGTNYEVVDAANGVIKKQGDDAEVTAEQLQTLIDKQLELARTEGLLSSLKSAYEAYYATQTEVSEASAAYSSTQERLNGLLAEQSELQAEYAKNGRWVGEQGQRFYELEGEIKRTTDELNANKAALDSATDSAKAQADTIDGLSAQYANAEEGLSEIDNMLAILANTNADKAENFLSALEEMGMGLESFSWMGKKETNDLLNFLVSEWGGSTEELIAYIDQLNATEIEPKTAEIDGDASGAEQAVKDADEKATTLTRKEFIAMIRGDSTNLVSAANRGSGAVRGIPQYWKVVIDGDASGVSYAAGLARAAIASVTRSVNVNFNGSGFGRAAGGIRTHADGGLRYHAGGSIVNVPGYGYPLDLVGEAGAEAIVPLTNRRYSQPLVDLIAEGVAGRGGTTYNLYINDAKVNDDPAIQGKFLDLMYELSRRAEMQRG